MKVSAINSFSYVNKTNSSFKSINKQCKEELYKGENGEYLDMKGKASEYFEVKQNLSNKKLGSKFIIQPKNPKYKELNILVTPETKISSNNNDFSISIKNPATNNPSFGGRLYGSIRMDDEKTVDYKMQDQYTRFWTEGMFKEVVPKQPINTIVNDYNFFIPSDGDGTRYKDITTLQGGVTKPASYIPATLNGKQMSLVQGVIANFAHTTKLDDMFEFVRVKPAQGSAFAFLEALKNNQISTEKPIVFSWGDNFSDIDVSRLIKNHERSGSAFSLTVLPVEKERVKALSIIKPESETEKTVLVFAEKPQDDDFIESCAVKIKGEKKYLSAVSPYIISTPVLKWIKEKYTNNPESFKNPDKGYDFSSMVIAPALDAINRGEIKDENDFPLKMNYDVIEEYESWSDLGSQKDFSNTMKDIKSPDKYAYFGLPYEMRSSMYDNIDDKGNITFNYKSRKLFDNMVNDLNLNAENVIAYCKDDGIRI